MVWKILMIVVPLFALTLSCPDGEDCCTNPSKINRTDIEDVGEAYFEDGVKIKYQQLEKTASYEIKFENTNENATQELYLLGAIVPNASLFVFEWDVNELQSGGSWSNRGHVSSWRWLPIKLNGKGGDITTIRIEPICNEP